jgi:type VI protein secretion system component Hcp
MPMHKKSINKSQKDVKKPAGVKAGTTRLSGKAVTATKQVELTAIVRQVDKSSPKLFLNCANGSTK